MSPPDLLEIWAFLNACGKGSDKGSVHSYLPVYEQLFAPERRRVRNLLEVGVLDGHSLHLWCLYFERATVEGVDLVPGHGAMVFDARDPDHARHVLKERQFDVIIDDGDHAAEAQFRTYRALRDHLAPGGIYVIEDVVNLAGTRDQFEAIDPRRSVEIIDLRQKKGVSDDVLVVIRAP
jgi:hypothetical protein